MISALYRTIKTAGTSSFFCYFKKALSIYYNMKKLEKISNSLELPKEVVFDLPIIKMTGSEIVNIQNYKQIIEYSENYIKLKCVIVEGEQLIITKIDSDQIEIKGVIKNCGIL